MLDKSRLISDQPPTEATIMRRLSDDKCDMGHDTGRLCLLVYEAAARQRVGAQLMG